MKKRSIILGICCLLAAASSTVRAEDAPTKTSSQWLLLPTFTNNHKLGTSVGVPGAYLRKFDAQSQLSMFGVNAQYTSANSSRECSGRQSSPNVSVCLAFSKAAR